jgi:Arc/MetJ-type ribon-helix-helix transcriptional regulator
MEFKKVTISLPKNLYEEGMVLVKNGLFSNFSDLVRSGIREEFKELQPVMKDFDEKAIYKDENLVAGVKQSMKEAEEGKGKVLKSEKEVDEYLGAL